MSQGVDKERCQRLDQVVAQIAIALSGAPSEEMLEAFEAALSKLSLAVSVNRAALFRLHGTQRLRLVTQWHDEALSPRPYPLLDGEAIAALREQLLAGTLLDLCCGSGEDVLCALYAQERTGLSVVAPMVIAGDPVGFLVLDCLERRVFTPQESEAIVSVSQVLGGMLLRHLSEQKFRTLFEHTTDAVMTLDRSGFIECNRATLALFGCTDASDFVRHHPGELSPAKQADGSDSFEAAARHVDRAFKEGSCRFEWLHKRVDDGAVFPAEVLLVAMELEGERFLQAVVRDITTRHERDQMLEEFNTRLTRQVQSEIERRRRSEQALFRQARVATMGEMVSAISHHWRQPLSVIALSVQAIEEEYSEGLIDSERMAQLSYTCLNEIKKLSETLNMLRGMVPKSASHQSSIAEEIESVTRIVEPEFGAHHILLTAQTPSPSAACRPLPQEFRQVLFALLLNARDAILMQDKKSGWITVSVEKSEALETITIEDSGGGFCPEAIDRAFEPFFTTKERGRGSGVINGVGTGLYIAKLLIEEQMGGHITLENGPEGARVKLHLPC